MGCIRMPIQPTYYFSVMKIHVIGIGKTQQPYLKEGINLFLDRLKHYTKLQYTELPDVKNGHLLSLDQLKRKEGELFLKHINPQDILILLDEKGTLHNSKNFADFLSQQETIYANRTLVFLIGGAFGFDNNIYEQAQHRISLSKMTFTHQMVRLFLLEQIYRAHTILRGIPYHNE